MAHVLPFAPFKGGVGKTTSVLNLAAYLAQQNARVLMIDLDPQSSLTKWCKVDPSSVDYSIYEVLINHQRGTQDATLATDFGAWLIPASPTLAGAEQNLSSRPARELLLRKALAKTALRDFDYILIDAPPNLGLLNQNALAAATAVIVPLQPEELALQTLDQLQMGFTLVEDFNADLTIGGIFYTMMDSRRRLDKHIKQRVDTAYTDAVFAQAIPRDARVAEAPIHKAPLTQTAPTSAGALAYAALAREIKERFPYG